jgi:hypothetical protein
MDLDGARVQSEARLEKLGYGLLRPHRIAGEPVGLTLVRAAGCSDQTLFDPVSDGPVARDALQIENTPLPRIVTPLRLAIRRWCHSMGI